jgi:hypothetical protein
VVQTFDAGIGTAATEALLRNQLSQVASSL